MNTLMNRIARWRAAAAMLGAIVLPAAMLAVGSAAAAEERPGLEASRGFIEKLADDAIRTWGTGYPSETERLAAMESLIRANFDLGFIVRGVLGRAGRKLDPAEREAFGALFYEFFREVYLPNLSRFHRDDLRVIGARPRGKRDVAVRSEVRGFSGEWVEVDWRGARDRRRASRHRHRGSPGSACFSCSGRRSRR